MVGAAHDLSGYESALKYRAQQATGLRYSQTKGLCYLERLFFSKDQ